MLQSLAGFKQEPNIFGHIISERKKKSENVHIHNAIRLILYLEAHLNLKTGTPRMVVVCLNKTDILLILNVYGFYLFK